MGAQSIRLSEEQLDHIARMYFADKRDQDKVKDAISDAFQCVEVQLNELADGEQHHRQDGGYSL